MKVRIPTILFLIVQVYPIVVHAQQSFTDHNLGYTLIFPSKWMEFSDPTITRGFESPESDRICTIKVTRDESIGKMGMDLYVEEMTGEKMRSFLKIVYDRPEIHQIGAFPVAGRKGLQTIWSGYLPEGKVTGVSFQVFRGSTSYTLNCIYDSDNFSQYYKQFLDISQSFELR